MNFNLMDTDIKGLKIVEYKNFEDNRGFFQEISKTSSFVEMGVNYNFVQDNISSSKINVVRGLHYQKGHFAQTKLVFVLKGEIFDVVVDLRNNSESFGQYKSFTIRERDNRALLIPKGFAHGFCSLKPETLVFYKNDNEYSPLNSKGIVWDDETLDIDWPVKDPILSKIDSSFPKFDAGKTYYEL